MVDYYVLTKTGKKMGYFSSKKAATSVLKNAQKRNPRLKGARILKRTKSTKLYWQ